MKATLNQGKQEYSFNEQKIQNIYSHHHLSPDWPNAFWTFKGSTCILITQRTDQAVVLSLQIKSNLRIRREKDIN